MAETITREARETKRAFTARSLSTCVLTGRGHRQQEKENAPQPQFAPPGVVPFAAGMNATTIAARSQAHGADAQCERNVRICGGDARLGPDAQVPVDGT